MTKTKVLVVFAVLAFGVAFGAAAQEAYLDLVGTVSEEAVISVTPLAAANALNLATTAGNLQVATLTYRCNSADGFSIDVISQHNFILTGDDGLSQYNSLPYTLTAGNATNVSAPSEVIGTTAPQFTDVSTGVFISYTGSTSLVPDSYRDRLTFSITAN